MCYATWDNQEAVKGLIASGGDIAIVVGGYNSSNTSHLVELLEEHFPTYYVKDPDEILDPNRIRHLRWRAKEVVESESWLAPLKLPKTILVTAGASCPDAVVDAVITKIAAILGLESELERAITEIQSVSTTS